MATGTTAAADDRRRDPRRGRVGHRGNDPRMARQGRRPDQGRRHDRRDLDRQGRRRAALARQRHGQRDPRRGGRHGHRRAGDRPHRLGDAAAPAPATGARRGSRSAPPPSGAGTDATARAAAPAAAPRSAGEPRPPARPTAQGLAGGGARGGGRGRRPARASPAAARPGGSSRPTCCARRRRRRHAPRGDGATAPRDAHASAEHAADEGRRGGARPLHGASRASIPTATSFRTLTVTALDARRRELKAAGRKVSFTHLIAYAIARAAEDMPVMADHFAEIDGKPHRVDDGQVNLGLAVDVEKKDGSRTLMVPVIRDAGRPALRRASWRPTTRSSRRRARTR